jgi:hypothetical protein
MRQAIVTLIKTTKGNQQEAATRHPEYRYFDTTVPGRDLSIDPEKFFLTGPRISGPRSSHLVNAQKSPGTTACG